MNNLNSYDRSIIMKGLNLIERETRAVIAEYTDNQNVNYIKANSIIIKGNKEFLKDIKAVKGKLKEVI